MSATRQRRLYARGRYLARDDFQPHGPNFIWEYPSDRSALSPRSDWSPLIKGTTCSRPNGDLGQPQCEDPARVRAAPNGFVVDVDRKGVGSLGGRVQSYAGSQIE